MRKSYKEIYLFGIFIALFIFMSILKPNQFLTIDNLQSMAFQIPELGIFSIAMMLTMITGGINLSITSITTLSGIISAFVLTSNFSSQQSILGVIAGVLISIITAILCGTLNGIIIAFIGVSPVLATLGTMILFQGISMDLTKGGAVSGFPELFYWFGHESIGIIPVPMIIFIVFAVFTAFLLERTEWGSRVYMVGADPIATKYSGIDVKKILMLVYIYSSLLCGVVAILMNSRYNSVRVDYGSSYLLQSIVAVALGGTNIKGGYGKVAGTFLAVCILQVLSSGFNILGLSRYLVDISMGIILLLVLMFNYLAAKIVLKRKSTI
ncbi:MAG: rhamnose transport system permease protein [Clostridiales bacterium]|nr:rhamnose transport system permease protein [Clostridiales bacterium]